LALLSLLFTTCGVPRSASGLARYRFGEAISNSMEPVIHKGDLFIWDAHAYRKEAPKRMDMVCFESPEDALTMWSKRCVAVAGDEVEIREDILHLNGVPQQAGPCNPPMEPRRSRSPMPMPYLGPLRVPEGTVYCLGENTKNSYDSRYWGPLRKEAIRGKVLFIYWSKGKPSTNKAPL
jgi:signal peptidase I